MDGWLDVWRNGWVVVWMDKCMTFQCMTKNISYSYDFFRPVEKKKNLTVDPRVFNKKLVFRKYREKTYYTYHNEYSSYNLMYL